MEPFMEPRGCNRRQSIANRIGAEAAETGLEVSGALLISGSLLLPLILRRWDQLAIRGHVSPQNDPELEDMHELAYAAVGAILLFSGFTTQLSGYVLQYSSTGLYVAAFGVAIGSLV